MSLRFRVDGADRVRDFAIALPEKIKRETMLGLSQVAYDNMQKGADAHTQTGALFQSVYNRATPTGGREVGHDPGRAPHAAFVVFGTRPHEIRPRNKKVLRWPSGNGFIFARRVWHPGYEGDDYVTRSAVAALDRLREIIDDLDVFR